MANYSKSSLISLTLLPLLAAVSVYAGSGGLSFSYRASSRQSQTYYVTTAGNDNNSCLTSANACSTVQGALTKVPHDVRHHTVVSVGAGSFPCFTVEGFDFQPGYDAGTTISGDLVIQGTLSAATHTGNMSGDLSNASRSAATDSAYDTVTMGAVQNWTAHDLKGLLFQMNAPSGTPIFSAGGTQTYTICDNTNTQITICGHWTNLPNYAGPGTNSTYKWNILDWGTTINTACTLPVNAGGVNYGALQDTAATSAIFVSNIQSGAQGSILDTTSPFQPINASIVISQFAFSGALQRALYADEGGQLMFAFNKIGNIYTAVNSGTVQWRNQNAITLWANNVQMGGGFTVFAGGGRWGGGGHQISLIGNYVTGGIGYLGTPLDNSMLTSGHIYSYGNFYGSGVNQVGDSAGLFTVAPDADVLIDVDHYDTYTTQNGVGIFFGYLPAAVASSNSGGGHLTIQSASISNMAGAAILLKGGSVSANLVVGSGNGGFAWDIQGPHASATIGAGVTVSGSNDFRLSPNLNPTYAQVRGATQLMDMGTGNIVATTGFPNHGSPFVNDSTVVYPNVTLPTCAASSTNHPSFEWGVVGDTASGAATGHRSRLCMCTSDGSSTYKWQNIVSGTVGTATTCSD